MVQIAGKYKLTKSENLTAYLQSVGCPDDFIKVAERAATVIEIIVEGNKYSINSGPGINDSFTLNEEFDESFPITGSVLKRIVKQESDNKIIISRTMKGGHSETRTYDFTENGFTLTLNSAYATAVRYYSKI